jgi:hypothetical protein
LTAELRATGIEPVTLSVVPDPFCGFSHQQLQGEFEVAIPFKTHFLVDLAVPFDRYLRRHHRRYARRSLSLVTVERAHDPFVHASEWADLYGHLVARRGITGLRAFSSNALARQLVVPGCHYFRAVSERDVVGALVCYLDRGVAYAHLVSTTLVGQQLMAPYALHWSAIEYFRGKARWLALGGVPGYLDQGNEGLAFFKRGWATAICRTYFCAKVLNRTRYDELCNRLGDSRGPYFPPYRAVEFR